MKAVTRDRYGPPDVLQLREIEKPSLTPDGVLVRVHAASINPYDWHMLRGVPYLVRLMEGVRTPKAKVLGADAAGVVQAVGSEVQEFKPGDEVFGTRYGSLAEYFHGRERNFVGKPSNSTFEEAAALPLAGVTALQGLRDRGRLQSGQRVLINGAAGGVGTFAVQIAKWLGAHVTGVCSTKNVELVRSLGADHVVDYTVDDFSRNRSRYDFIFDVVGNRSLRDFRRALTPDGTFVFVGGGGVEASQGHLLGPLVRSMRGSVLSRFVSQDLLPFLAKITKDDLLVLKKLVETGKVKPIVDRTYPLSEAADAMRYLETGHARGKVIVTV
jgi:NADPH:quinone reductase-like Zn-dependent oxidoreductase